MDYGMRYKIVGTLDEGAQAKVVIVPPNDLPDKLYVAKIYPYKVTEKNIQIGNRNEGLMEIVLTLALSHPNIVSAVDFDMDNKNMYLILEKADTNLDSYLNDYNLKFSQKIKFIHQIGQSLNYIRKNNIIHCDIKPKNFLLKNGNIILADFGLAKRVDLITGNICHNALYRSPEMLYQDKTPLYSYPYEKFFHKEQFYEMADIWGYGIICLEIIYNKTVY